MNNLKEKAKTLSDLFWENELEWSKWLLMGVTESKQVALAPKYQEKWVRLEDVKKWIKDLDDFLVQWLWNDKGKIPSQDLAILLEWREKFENVEGV